MSRIYMHEKIDNSDFNTGSTTGPGIKSIYVPKIVSLNNGKSGYTSTGGHELAKRLILGNKTIYDVNWFYNIFTSYFTGGDIDDIMRNLQSNNWIDALSDVLDRGQHISEPSEFNTLASNGDCIYIAAKLFNSHVGELGDNQFKPLSIAVSADTHTQYYNWVVKWIDLSYEPLKTYLQSKFNYSIGEQSLNDIFGPNGENYWGDEGINGAFENYANIFILNRDYLHNYYYMGNNGAPESGFRGKYLFQLSFNTNNSTTPISGSFITIANQYGTYEDYLNNPTSSCKFVIKGQDATQINYNSLNNKKVVFYTTDSNVEYLYDFVSGYTTTSTSSLEKEIAYFNNDNTQILNFGNNVTILSAIMYFTDNLNLANVSKIGYGTLESSCVKLTGTNKNNISIELDSLTFNENLDYTNGRTPVLIEVFLSGTYNGAPVGGLKRLLVYLNGANRENLQELLTNSSLANWTNNNAIQELSGAIDTEINIVPNPNLSYSYAIINSTNKGFESVYINNFLQDVNTSGAYVYATSLSSVTYEIHIDGYQTIRGVLNKNNPDRTITDNDLVPNNITYTITLPSNITATVKVNGEIITGANGVYSVETTATSISYSIERQGYQTIEGTLNETNNSVTIDESQFELVYYINIYNNSDLELHSFITINGGTPNNVVISENTPIELSASSSNVALVISGITEITNNGNVPTRVTYRIGETGNDVTVTGNTISINLSDMNGTTNIYITDLDFQALPIEYRVNISNLPTDGTEVLYSWGGENPITANYFITQSPTFRCDIYLSGVSIQQVLLSKENPEKTITLTYNYSFTVNATGTGVNGGEVPVIPEGGEDIIYYYYWHTENGPIEGETGATYTLSTTATAYTVTCEVSTDLVGSTPKGVTMTATVGNPTIVKDVDLDGYDWVGTEIQIVNFTNNTITVSGTINDSQVNVSLTQYDRQVIFGPVSIELLNTSLNYPPDINVGFYLGNENGPLIDNTSNNNLVNYQIPEPIDEGKLITIVLF